MSWSALSVLWTLLFAKGVWCLSLIELEVPSRVFEGDTIRLTCLYDLEGDELYSVEWYKDNYRFFRYLPSDLPQKEYLLMKGVLIDEQQSGTNFVTLKDVNVATSGEYDCQVSTEAPSYQTQLVKAQLTVEERKIPVFTVASSSRISYGLLSFAVVLFVLFI